MTSYTAEEALGVVGLFFVGILAWSGLMLVWMPLDAVIFGASFASLATVVLLWVRAVFGVGPRLFQRAPGERRRRPGRM